MCDGQSDKDGIHTWKADFFCLKQIVEFVDVVKTKVNVSCFIC